MLIARGEGQSLGDSKQCIEFLLSVNDERLILVLPQLSRILDILGVNIVRC